MVYRFGMMFWRALFCLEVGDDAFVKALIARYLDVHHTILSRLGDGDVPVRPWQ